MNSILMTKLSSALRLLTLSILFGGSLTAVISAITLIKTAEAHGIPVPVAALANAPIFIAFSKLALVAGIGLILGESLNYAASGHPGRLKLVRYLASLSCAALTMVFAFVIVPPMQEMQKSISNNEVVHAEFRNLHKTSRFIFSAIMLLALTSLLIPVFEISSPKDPV